MEKRRVKPYTKEQSAKFAETVLAERLNCTVTGAKYIGGGSYGYVYLCTMAEVEEKVIMKACRVDGMCEQEANAIRLLGADSLIPFPKIYFTRLADETVPLDFICEEYIAASNCLNPKYLLCSRSTKQRFSDKIVDTMAHWHSKTNDKFGLLEDAHCDSWVAYYKPFAGEILESARLSAESGALKGEILQTMEDAFLQFNYIFSEPVERASLIHGDLNVMNIMADRRLNPVAIIDPLESRWADKEYDLFQLRNLTGEKFKLYETYKKKYPVSEKCDIKCAFYGLYNEVYCNIMAGSFNAFLLDPVVKRMRQELDKIHKL